MTITHNHKGLKIQGKPVLGNEADNILEHAVNSYGFLIPFNKTVCLDEFITRVDNYSVNPKTQYITDVLKAINNINVY
jgi:hypothetical protein